MTIDNAIMEKRKLCEEWNQELSLTPGNDITHIENCKSMISLYEQEIEWLQELKIFKELYPDTDTKSSLKTNYENGYTDGQYDKVETFRQLLSEMQCNGITEYRQGYNDCIKELWRCLEL